MKPDADKGLPRKHLQRNSTNPSTIFNSKNIAKEYLTIAAMIDIYCRKIHGRKNSRCPKCLELLDYVEKRLQFCRYAENKPRCRECPTPCFAQPQKALIKKVMKFSGPRLMLYHPFLALRHLGKKASDF
ncbi:MAG: nitrous oxide-stimulated promoter family protein [Deltaproteobacteria bacterium]|nr:nitrous oxide-stimulated promoter family protein [Deltaproteobacteria bacterium]